MASSTIKAILFGNRGETEEKFLLSDDPVFIIEGNDIKIENYGKITKYENDVIALKNKRKTITIVGNDFMILTLNKTFINIKGSVNRIEM